ncbi:MAG: bifunctional 5,10-methylenetetrahydrofolate dehydrogenase/5,10-methenyltetrahydrofolate cyclohydrolase [Reichenbachiella sp.]|uniref:bifunctional 5,10-methylenetetrahydrofolate dehydrogenase/5,10-methenyltetrahydrofolate cyclohydrolase n=1 Tax=Reichenbachiella sp. TaxID=2184521 RepID=UPI003264CD30
MATLLDGKGVSDQIKAEIKEEVAAMVARGEKRPNLATILVGENPASHTYVNHKIKACKEVGFISTHLQFSEDISEEYLLKKMDALNEDEEIDGYIVQLPLPDHIHKEKIIDRIKPMKDVDGFHHLNFGRMSSNLPCHLPATPNGILELFRRYKIETKGKHVVMVGASNIVGLPMSILLAKGHNPGDATVTLTHIHTVDLASHTRQADILIVATGVAGLIKADMVKEGVIVVDVGINKVEDPTRKSGFRIVGDVEFEEVEKKASYITPVPKGVGPMTIVSLLMNTLDAAKKTYS